MMLLKKIFKKCYLYKCSEGTNSQVYVLKKYYIRVHNKFEYVTNFLHETIRMYPLFFLGIEYIVHHMNYHMIVYPVSAQDE